GTIETGRPVFGLKHQPGARLPIEALRVAMAVTPDFFSRIWSVHERVVAWNGPVVIHAQRLAAQRTKLLRDRPIRCIAGCDVEFSVRPEFDSASRVELRGRDVVYDNFAFRQSARSFLETNNPDRVASKRIRHVQELVPGEIRMKAKTHQPALAPRFDVWKS